MNKYYKITQKDWQDLWSGKVKYLIHFCQWRGYGEKRKWWDVIRARIKSKYSICSFGYPYKFQYYIISVYCPASECYSSAWTTEDMKAFIKENKIKPGDQVFIYYTFPGSSGTIPIGHGKQYVILKEGWQVLWTFMGA